MPAQRGSAGCARESDRPAKPTGAPVACRTVSSSASATARRRARLHLVSDASWVTTHRTATIGAARRPVEERLHEALGGRRGTGSPLRGALPGSRRARASRRRRRGGGQRAQPPLLDVSPRSPQRSQTRSLLARGGQHLELVRQRAPMARCPLDGAEAARAAGMSGRWRAGILRPPAARLRAVRASKTSCETKMDRAGAQEILMPAVSSRPSSAESGRWETVRARAHCG